MSCVKSHPNQNNFTSKTQDEDSKTDIQTEVPEKGEHQREGEWVTLIDTFEQTVLM